MKKRRSSRFDSGVDIPVTPLIDIVFLLLIYFLLTSHFIKHQAIRVDLPKSKLKAQKIKKEILSVTVTREGKIYLNGSEVPKGDLLARLTRFWKEGRREVIIEADRESRVQLLVDVMDAVKRAGFEKIMLKTKQVSDGF